MKMRSLLFKNFLLGFGILILLASGDSEGRKRRSQALAAAKDLIEEVSVTAPKDQEVCFSPDSRCDLKLIKFIESATKSIDIAIFDLNLDQLVHVLIEQSRKIPVKVLVDARQAQGKASLVPVLIKAGVEVRLGTQRGIMHHKFTLVDGRRLETGSFNYTNHASRANQENQIYLSNPEIVSEYLKRFKLSWEEGRKTGG